MVHRGRSARPDTDAVFVPGTIQLNAGHSNGGKHVRQFTTRSRAKSTASFKGLMRSLTHEGHVDGTELLGHHHYSKNLSHSFKKCKSSDGLYRRRTFSGLNMTALVGNKNGHMGGISNNSSDSHSTSGSVHSIGPVRLKPRRTKSTHSVLELYDANDLYDTDEEVEYFTDEEGFAQGQPGQIIPVISNDTKAKHEANYKSAEKVSELSKSFSSLYKKDDEEQQPGPVKKLSYKPPFHYINETEITKSKLQQNEDHINDNASDNTDNNVDYDADDHIGHPGSGFSEPGAHSLQRQERNFGSPVSHHQPIKEIADASRTHQNNMPTMILSQSTGVERRLEDPSFIQNSLSNNVEALHDQMTPDPSDNKSQREHEEDTLPANKTSEKSTKNRSEPKNFISSISSLTNNLHQSVPEKTPKSTRNSPIYKSRLTPDPTTPSKPPNHKTSNLSRKDDKTNTDLNNFSQFLKTDETDGDSRTQRKLWLQRESSFVDTAFQNGMGSILNTNNFEMKRQFEKIFHDYKNIRRFCNPINESLARVDLYDKTKNPNNNSKDVRFTTNTGHNYTSSAEEDKKLADIFSAPQNAELHRVLSTIWNEETDNFNNAINPLHSAPSMKHSHSEHYNGNILNAHTTATSRHPLRGTMGSGINLHNQRTVNSLQPSTRAVNRRIENTTKY